MRFSLGTFLLLVTVLALAVSHYHTSRQLSATRYELAEFRYQYGHLVVEDPSRPHLLRYANQENPWKWHASLPNGKTYRLMFGVGLVPNAGIPSVSELQHVQSTSVVGTGENMTLFVSLKDHDSESLILSVGCDGAQTVGAVIPKWYSNTSFNISRVGHREAFSADPGEPFVVFRYTERKPTPGGGSAADLSPEEGVVVWAVPVK